MTRPTLFLVFLLACTASRAAEDGYLVSSEPAESRPASVAKDDAADDPFGARKLDATESSAPSPFATVFHLQDEPPTVHAEVEFHPLCDCCCTIPPLDTYCYCDEPCCTTDEWFCHPCQGPHGNCYLGEDGQWVSNDCFCDVWGDPPAETTSAFRFGWWGV